MTTTVKTLIAKIETLGTALKGEKDTKMVVVKLKEANGKSFEWSSWYVDTFKEYEVGDVIEIEPKLVFKEGNKYPFRNIERVLGRREASEINTLNVLDYQPGKESESSESTNGTQGNTYDQGKAIERRSIERQTSLKLVVELFKGGCAADDLESVVDAVIKAAIPLEEHLARQGALAHVPGPSVPTGSPTNTNGASPTDGTPDLDSYKMETVGDLFNAVKARYSKTPADIFDALSVQSTEELLVNTTIANAWGQLNSLWEGPPAKKTGEEQEEIEA